MTEGRTGQNPIVAVFVAACMVAVLVCFAGLGWWVYSRAQRGPMPTWGDRVEQTPGLADLEWSSERRVVAGGPSRPHITSHLIFAPDVDGQAAAAALEKTDFDESTWEIQGRDSRLQLQHFFSDARVSGWWLDTVPAVEDAGGTLNCSALGAWLSCTVDGLDESATRALVGDLSGIRSWVEGPQDEGEKYGFELVVDGAPVERLG